MEEWPVIQAFQIRVGQSFWANFPRCNSISSLQRGIILGMKTAPVALALLIVHLSAQDLPPRRVPARTIPVPRDVSPELQKLIARPIEIDSTVPRTPEEWKSFLKPANEEAAKHASDVARRLHVRLESGTIAGVHVFHVKPELVSERNKARLMMHVHGGAYVFLGDMAATREAILLAHYAGIETVSVDYRMPPAAPFPAAVDDSVAVWRELTKTHNPRSMALFGSSAGGGLTLATTLKLKLLGQPLPGALMLGTPWADLTKTGDTESTNGYIDNVLPKYEGWLEAAARLYAGSHDLKEPLLSPVYADLSGFPPAVLVSGTRDDFSERHGSCPSEAATSRSRRTASGSRGSIACPVS
jgi:monoterpene epsilon-lactone hydrolase